jgi:ubiquitin thioesterase protein OTUB1
VLTVLRPPLAIGFSYFEQLILSGDPEKLQLEVARMTSLNNYLSTYGGYDLELFEDMVYETINLLKDLAACVPDTNAAMTLLMQRFNDRECSNAIVYHLRLLAGSWLKGNFTQYEPFLDTGGDVATWAHLNIEVPDKEIDHLSIILLTSILLKPIGVVLEIAYLDRTPGSEVNTYRFPDETNGQDPMNLGPIIYLLFRPDHYDILYKSPRESIMPTPQPVALNLQVNRAASFSHHHQITSHPPSLHSFATLDYSPLAMLPGFGGPPSALTSMTTSSPASPMHNAYASPAQSWMQSPFSDTSMQQNIPPPPPPPSQPQALAPGPTQAPSPSQPQLPVAGAPAKPNQPVDYQLRFSSQCFHLKNPTADSSLLPQGGAFPEPSFTTTMFKNSHFNKAHYNNPHFHPEEWAPEDEAHERVTSGVVKKKSKTKSEQ